MKSLFPLRGMIPLLVGLSLSLTSLRADEASTPELLKTFVDELVTISPGREKFPATFEMGRDDTDRSERPRHTVRLTSEFAIAKYEVPQNLYVAVMGKNPSRWKGPRNSVEMMTWQEANDFCQKLTTLLRAEKLISDDEIIRLPTEAEWEYCCRAGTTSRYSFGDDAQKPGDVSPIAGLLNAYAWHTGNAAGNDPAVGALKPNPWGLYDMHGYLWEFTADGWSPDYEVTPRDGKAEPVTPDTKSIVVRGGSWKDRFEELTSFNRQSFRLTDKDDAVGFRCVKSKVQ